MHDPDHRSLTDDEFLSLRIGGDAGQPARLLLIGRPRDGLVRVREWTTDTLNSEGEDFDVDPTDLLEDIERAYDARFEVSEELYRVRLWLGQPG
jgi:hypothetical protein